MHNDIAAAKALPDPVSGQLVGLDPSGYPANRALLDGARSTETQAQADLTRSIQEATRALSPLS
jgi:hypothetical protein